jgi:hypothetical protein
MIYLELPPEPLDGAEVLDAIGTVLRRRGSMPDRSPELGGQWILFTWADASQIVPRRRLR